MPRTGRSCRFKGTYSTDWPRGPSPARLWLVIALFVCLFASGGVLASSFVYFQVVWNKSTVEPTPDRPVARPHPPIRPLLPPATIRPLEGAGAHRRRLVGQTLPPTPSRGCS